MQYNHGEKQGLIRPRKLSSDIGTTFSHAIRDHFIVHNKYRKNGENVWLNYLVKAKYTKLVRL